MSGKPTEYFRVVVYRKGDEDEGLPIIAQALELPQSARGENVDEAVREVGVNIVNYLNICARNKSPELLVSNEEIFGALCLARDFQNARTIHVDTLDTLPYDVQLRVYDRTKRPLTRREREALMSD